MFFIQLFDPLCYYAAFIYEKLAWFPLSFYHVLRWLVNDWTVYLYMDNASYIFSGDSIPNKANDSFKTIATL